MKIFQIIKKDGNINVFIAKKISIFKKEKYKSSTFYSILLIPIYKIRHLVNEKKIFCFGILIYKKNKKQTEKINKLLQNTKYIYTSYHTGEIYYLCNLIKNNFSKFKDVKIVSCFAYLKQILILLDFPESWIKKNFICVKDFIPSCMYLANENGNIVNLIETDYEKGILFNKKHIKKNISQAIADLLEEKDFEFTNIKINNNISKQKTVLIFPESIFNGNLDLQFLKMLIQKLQALNYKILINSKKNTYENLLDKNVERIFLPFKDTYELATNCEAIIGVRSGFFDCVQTCAKGETNLHIIYNNYCYPCYNHMRNFKDFCLSTYGLSHSIFSSNIFEYLWLENNEHSYNTIMNKILKNIKGDDNA